MLYVPSTSATVLCIMGTIFVTGGAGFIGSNFIRLLLKRAPSVRVVCVSSLNFSGNRENLRGLSKKRLTLIKGSINDAALMARLIKKYKPEYAINFAAESHVDRSIYGGAEQFVRTNVLGTTVLMQALLRAPHLKKFLQVSTDEVYGALPLHSKKKFTENSPLLPNSPYASSKAAADLVARSFFKTYGLPVVITRCSNNYGPYQHPEKLIPYSITRLMEGKPIAIYGDGLYVRDWIHVDDHCSALALALLHGEPGEVYNIGADDEVSNIALARRMLAYFKKDESDILYVKDRPGHDRRYAVNASKIQKQLGWKPRHSLNKSFKMTVEWYIKNNSWVKRALKRAGVANAHI